MLDQCSIRRKGDEQFVDEVREHHRAKVLEGAQDARIGERARIEEAADDIAKLRIFLEPPGKRAAKPAGSNNQRAPNIDAGLRSTPYQLSLCRPPSRKSNDAEHARA